jgi:periplasmic protein TonB
MPSTAKDAFLEAIANSAQTEDTGAPPSSAAGAEIPVTVHASRYSATPKGGGKLPPIHEETRTVIIFPQGAVVRLSAAVTPGELVVLTNKRTGADVICRVTSVKTQPGIQNYVHLEFTQRALDYWEDASTGSANATDKSVTVTGSPMTKPPASPATTPIGSSYRVPSSPVPDVQTSTKTSEPAVVELKSVPSALPKITPLADAPADHVETAAANFQAPQSHVSEINAITPSVQKRPHVLPSRTPRFEPFEHVVPQENSGSKTIISFAIAAVVLLAIGAAAGALFLRNDRGVNVAQPIFSGRVATTSASASVPSRPEAPIVNSSAKASSPEVAASASAKIPPAEIPSHPPTTRASDEPAKSALAYTEPPKAGGQPQPALRPVINVGRISAPKIKPAAQNSSAPPVLPADASALPNILGESGVNAPTRSDPLAPVAPAPPPVVKGGQLQQPKLLSSVAAVFPPLARAQHVQGDVVIDALIDATGKVAATKVISGNPLLQKAAVDSLLLWKYEPARLNGQSIPIHINVTISFHLG